MAGKKNLKENINENSTSFAIGEFTVGPIFLFVNIYIPVMGTNKIVVCGIKS